MTLLTYDVILQMLCDEFDSLIAPKKIRRTNRNIIYLILKASAKGYELIANIVYMLDAKFDPARCQDADLESVAKLVGTEFLQGTGSGLVILITNENTVQDTSLLAGEYRYEKDADTIFTATVALETVIPAESTIQLPFFSTVKGSFPISEQPIIQVKRVDETAISPDLAFACLDNTSMLGSLDETLFEFRKRVLVDTDRVDILNRLETKIKNLPYIFECSVVFNQTINPLLVGDVEVAPYHLLLTLNGFPRDEIADIIAGNCIYPTVEVVGNGGVLKHLNPLLIDGEYKVYYKNFDFIPYDVEIHYVYNERVTLNKNLTPVMQRALLSYKNPTVRVPEITEADFYALIEGLRLPSVRVLNVTLKQDGVEVPFARCNRTSILKLNDVILTGEIS